MPIQVGTVDGLINITDKIKTCFVEAIDKFNKEVISPGSLNNLSVGDAFQRYTYPVYSGTATDYTITSLGSEVKTKTGNKQSPAYVTYCKKMGLLKTEGSTVFELTALGKALKDSDITLEEYALVYMSKQGVFVDGICKGNLLVDIAEFFNKNSYITADLLSSFIAKKYGTTVFEKTRFDIILGALAAAKLLTKVGNTAVYVLSGIYQASILKYFYEKRRLISISLLDSDDDYSSYIGDFKNGIFDVLDKSNINLIQEEYPNLVKYINNDSDKDLPLQKITYGAPGTGKSHGTNKVVRNYKDTVRTTFHPDSDYSTFVGAYKPTTTREKMYGLDSVGKTVRYEYDGKPLETTKIVYKFIKQAFLKAYILAWKKMCQVKLSTSTPPTSTTTTPLITTPSPLSFEEGDGLVTITQVAASELTYKKEEVTTYGDIKKLWDNSWNNGVFTPKSDSGSGISLNRSVACAVYDQITNATLEDFDKGWEALIEALRSKDIVSSPGNQDYTLSYNDSDTTIKITTTNTKKKTRLNECFDQKQGVSIVGVEKGMLDILTRLDSNFDAAWNKLLVTASGTTSTTPTTSSTTLTDPLTDIRQFLVIEEINRGNCAQIFGDLFQLLDRKNGFSEYPIEADEDIQKALLDENPDDGLSFGKDGLTLPDEVKNELCKVFEGDANPDAIIEKICMGKVLALPSNLHIWATMNTSDQSLFPIDSAFKRRWDWEYKPIIKPADKNWKIQVGPGYDWWTFLEEVNKIINELTSSEDKKLGYFFAKAKKVGDEEVVDIDTMVNKVFFYLWNDVFKDYDLGHLQSFPKIKEDTSKTDSKERPYSFGDFFDKKEGKLNKEAVEDFMKAFMPNTATTTTATATTAAGTTPQEPTEQTTE